MQLELPSLPSAESMAINRGRTLTEPQLPAFLCCRDQWHSIASRPSGSSYESLLNRLKGELGFRHQQTALLWLLDKLESCEDLRGMVLVLLERSES